MLQLGELHLGGGDRLLGLLDRVPALLEGHLDRGVDVTADI